MPQILADKGEDEPIRMWSAGCASGGGGLHPGHGRRRGDGGRRRPRAGQDRRHRRRREALSQARQARYGSKQVEGVPPELLERYFERNGDGYVFSKELRRSVIFGRHDLIQDAPISRIDLLGCRTP
jgi:two-component system, chemotaxis family, CheB/CheR fusion protein